MTHSPAAPFLSGLGPQSKASWLDLASPRKAATIEPQTGRENKLASMAYQRGFSAACEAAKAETERLLAEGGERARLELAAARNAWVTEESAQLAEWLRNAIADMEEAIAQAAARALAPFLTAAIREKAVAELAEALILLRSPGGPHYIEVSGPADLIEALARRCGEIIRIEAVPAADAGEITITAGATVLKSAMQAWVQCVGDTAA